MPQFNFVSRAMVTAAAALVCAPRASAQALDVATVSARAQTAYFAEDTDALRKLAAATSAWATAASANEKYTYAYLQFRLLQLASAAKRKGDMEKAGESCVSVLGTLTAREPRAVEAFALQSACYGYLAGLGGFGAIGNGSRSGKSIDAANKLDARNPRVLLVGGFGLYFRPKFVGGDKVKGCELFRGAAAAFDASKPGAGVSWGAAESHLWVGRCAADAGDAAGAKREFEKTLALAPDFLAAKRRLGGLPGHS